MLITQNTRLAGILVFVTLLLITPLVAMQFTKEVNWSVTDFIAMGILLYGTGGLCEMVLRNVKSFQKRLLIIGILLFMFFIIWAQMAVGLLGKLFTGQLW